MPAIESVFSLLVSLQIEVALARSQSTSIRGVLIAKIICTTSRHYASYSAQGVVVFSPRHPARFSYKLRIGLLLQISMSLLTSTRLRFVPLAFAPCLSQEICDRFVSQGLGTLFGSDFRSSGSIFCDYCSLPFRCGIGFSEDF